MGASPRGTLSVGGGWGLCRSGLRGCCTRYRDKGGREDHFGGTGRPLWDEKVCRVCEGRGAEGAGGPADEGRGEGAGLGCKGQSWSLSSLQCSALRQEGAMGGSECDSSRHLLTSVGTQGKSGPGFSLPSPLRMDAHLNFTASLSCRHSISQTPRLPGLWSRAVVAEPTSLCRQRAALLGRDLLLLLKIKRWTPLLLAPLLI